MRKMDLLSRCKDKLAYFRIKELKDVLSQLGLAKQGKKQDLVDKILSALSDEQVSKAPGSSKKNTTKKEEIARIIDDTYRKMQIHIHGSNELTSKGQSSSDVNNGKLKEEEVSSLHLDVKVRCPCRSSLLMESMVKCESPRCHVWQHIGCVIVPDTPMEGTPPVPSQFYCEVCRLSRADPFWVTVAQPLQPTKLTASDYPTDGSKPMQKLEQTFQLTRADGDMLQKPEYDVQVWCILLNDKVPYRMQWPLFADLQVNGVPVRTTNRPGNQLLGANGRDDGPMITNCTREGTNKISLSGCDDRIFCLGVRIGRKRTVQQVLNLIPKEADGERFEDALARVCRCIGGGNAKENADSDDDLEVVADSLTISLRCPMTASRIKIAGRFKPCAHIGCFDLESFVELNQRSRKWQCPICVKNYSLENIIIDPYFNRIVAMMRDCGEDVNEIDLKPDGCWRVRNERERQDLAQWHFPDGSLCGEMEVVEGDLDTPKQIKQGVSEGHSNLKLRVKKTFDGLLEVNKPEDIPSLSSGSRLLEFENCCPKIMPLSSSATGSGREGEDPSVNQDAGGHFDFSSNNGNELDSLHHNFGPTGRTGNKLPSASSQSADIIILSDSDSDDENLVSHAIYESGQAEAATFPLSGTHASYQGMSRNLCPGLFNGDTVDSMEPTWPLPSATPAGSRLRLFGTDTNVAISSVAVQHNSVAVQHNSVACSTSMNGFPVAPVANIGPATQVPGSVCRLTIDLNSDVVENPLGFSGGDTSLQISVPSLPAATAMQSDLRNRPDMSNENWISLRFGAGDGGSGHVESAVTNGVNSSSLTTSKNAVLRPSAPADDSVQKTPKRPISSGPFSFPRQPRSVRPRPFAIDSE